MALLLMPIIVKLLTSLHQIIQSFYTVMKKLPWLTKLGFGIAVDNETLSYPTNPANVKSLQRRVNATKTEDGIHGPAWDSDNNSADFFVQDLPNPQNSTWIDEYGPLPPIPELPGIILLAAGLTVVAAYIVLLGKKSQKYQ
jgi:hypothetical protein